MRISCEACIENRLMPALNMKRTKRSRQATLALCKKPKSEEIYLSVCNSQNPAGSSYKVKGNVEQLFTKFLKEGKATVRLKEPPHDIVIKNADAVHLKGFLQALVLVLKGSDGSKIHFSQPPTKVQVIEKEKIIMNRSDIPLTGYPSTLRKLMIGGCRLLTVDRRIFKLKHLMHLCLSDNAIEALPPTLASLSLTCLELSGNQIKTFPVELCSGPLQKSLQQLNLASNQLSRLPREFCEFEKLYSLNLANNQLQDLPDNFGFMKSLALLNLDSNQLRVLPGSMRNMHLQFIYADNNPLDAQGDHFQQHLFRQQFNVPSLMELAARRIVLNRIEVKEGDVPVTLRKYLENYVFCSRCRKPLFNYILYGLGHLDLLQISQVVSCRLSHQVPIRIAACSSRCLS